MLGVERAIDNAHITFQYWLALAAVKSACGAAVLSRGVRCDIPRPVDRFEAGAHSLDDGQPWRKHKKRSPTEVRASHVTK